MRGDRPPVAYNSTWPDSATAASSRGSRRRWPLAARAPTRSGGTCTATSRPRRPPSRSSIAAPSRSSQSASATTSITPSGRRSSSSSGSANAHRGRPTTPFPAARIDAPARSSFRLVTVVAAPRAERPQWTAMKEGLPGGTLGVSSRSELEEARSHVARWIGSESTSARCLPALRSRRAGRPRPRRRRTPTACAAWRARLARRQPVRAVIESMNGARFVHDTLEEHGWEVLVADAQKVKGLAPLACKTDKIDARVLADAVLARSGAGDLAARPVDSARARAGALSAAPGPAPHDAQEPHPRDADHVRAPVPGVGPVRATPAASCSIAWRSPSRGGATSTPAWS